MTVDGAGRLIGFRFTGRTSEYFRIWIIGVALSLLTFGVYSAWAKVRTQQYFYRHTWLDGSSFEYLAEPRDLLRGRLLLAALLTDEIVRLAERDEQIEAVLWHEVGHVVLGHGLRRALEASALGVVAMAYYGGADPVTALFGSLPLTYAESRYSRAEETEADDAAVAALLRHGESPRHLARLLALLRRESGPGRPEMKYLSSHPATDERIERLERAAAASDARAQ